MTTREDKLRRLLEAGRTLVTELDPDAVLDRILDAARDATGARYAALGVLNDDRTALGRFLTLGVDDAAHQLIGDLPLGRGVLGELIACPEPLRLTDVGSHPHSYGFPAGHPVMHSFLGVPIMIRGEAWGNLYLSEKPDGEPFTPEDEDAAGILADWAATAIENARLYHSTEQRRQQLERAVQGLEAARDIADAISSASELERIMELIVKRGRALIDAQTVLIMLHEGDELVVSASAGHAHDARGRRLPISASTAGQVFKRRQPLRITDVATTLRVKPEDLGVPDAHTALLVPMLYRGASVGVLAAFDRGSDGGAFTAADEQLLRTFAASGANAVAIRRSVEADRLRSAIAASDQERARWARELHDETLQALGGLRVLLASALRRGNAERNEEAMRQAIEDVEVEIDNLRAIISDLRPSLLDDLGLLPALEALLNRRRDAGLKIDSELHLPEPGGAVPSKDLETTTYRLVQEALTNVVKHAQATQVRVLVEMAGDGELRIEIEDDGRGFDTGGRSSGFGLSGMRERMFLAGGTLEISSGDTGTTVHARIAAGRTAEPPSRADQLVS
jgi:signal transduction histidine kinase